MDRRATYDTTVHASCAAATLPAEIQSKLFDHFTRKSDYRSASLVCRGWRECAQRELFSSSTVRNPRQATYWLKLGSRARYPTLRLTLCRPVYTALGVRIIVESPSLVSLDVDSPVGGGYRWVTEAPGLQNLCLWSPELWPRDALPLRCRLRRLEISGSKLRDYTPLCSILASSKESLTTLRITTGASVRTFTAFFRAHDFPNLSHVVLENSDPSNSWPALLSTLPNLKALEFATFDSHSVDAVAAISRPSIQVLTFRRFGLFKQPEIPSC